jgi:hypothetical protein
MRIMLTVFLIMIGVLLLIRHLKPPKKKEIKKLKEDK